MSANEARNHTCDVGVRIEAIRYCIAKDGTGQPDLPYVNIGEPQRAEGHLETRHLKHRFESYVVNTGESVWDAKEGGE